MPSIFSIDPSNLANSQGLLLVSLIIIAVLIICGYKYLQSQSELARINRDCLEKIVRLERESGKIRESYDRAVNSLDLSQKQVIMLQTIVNELLKSKK